MRKSDELRANGCLRKAKDDEMIFVLLGRDESAPIAIRAWANHRINTGKNKATDDKIVEALSTALIMELER